MNGIGAAYGLIAALFVGAALGWAVDNYLLHSAPWGLILGVLLGFAAGLYGVYQALMKPNDPSD